MLVREITVEAGVTKPQTAQDLQIQALKRQKDALTQKTRQVKAQQQVQKAQAKLTKATSGQM